ncbi:MAG: Na+/H+ antiporter subunit E [Clostridiales bacterium]|nr:Na+/H+ antiporter subunit E [Clostridiales bacterium]
MKDMIKLFTVLNIFWLLLTNSLYWIDIVIGLIFSSVVSYFSFKLLQKRKIVLPSINIVIKYIVVLIYEIFISSFYHILRIISNNEENIVVFELDFEKRDTLELVMIANFITLTPGTVSIKISNNTIKVVTIESEVGSSEKTKKKLLDLFNMIFER